MATIVQKIFGARKPTSANKLAAENSNEGASPSRLANSLHLDLAQFIVGCAQSVGKQREHNEDALFSLTTNLVVGDEYSPFGLYIVADGMGGHLHGEIASSLAVMVMASFVIQKNLEAMLLPKSATTPNVAQEILRVGTLEAHQTIVKNVPGGGTTLTCALLSGDQLTISHVGDSRVYQLSSNGSIRSLTRDHSLVQRLVEEGQLNQEQAAVHPQKNVLYRALGQTEDLDPEITSYALNSASYLLLCSDGLWGVVSENELVHIVFTAPNPQVACQQMVEAANIAGGPDNITAILVHIP